MRAIARISAGVSGTFVLKSSHASFSLGFPLIGRSEPKKTRSTPAARMTLAIWMPSPGVPPSRDARPSLAATSSRFRERSPHRDPRSQSCARRRSCSRPTARRPFDSRLVHHLQGIGCADGIRIRQWCVGGADQVLVCRYERAGCVGSRNRPRYRRAGRGKRSDKRKPQFHRGGNFSLKVAPLLLGIRQTSPSCALMISRVR